MPEAQRSFEYFEEVYKQGLVSTASLQRVVLVLYERILLLLKQAQASGHDLTLMRRHLAQAQQVLAHLLRMFMENQSLRSLYLSHERIAQQLVEVFRQKPFQAALLNDCIKRIETYQETLRHQLQIRNHFPDEEPARLNVRRQPPMV
jgi:hypothetical protein